VEPAVGPDLDTAVAERVFRAGPGGGWCPPYSTDTAAAWEVVERMLARHPGFELTHWDDQTRPWAAAFGTTNYPDDVWGDGCGRTAAEAICRAALAAVGADD
jgi:hypothetical protein